VAVHSCKLSAKQMCPIFKLINMHQNKLDSQLQHGWNEFSRRKILQVTRKRDYLDPVLNQDPSDRQSDTLASKPTMTWII
jgi:hypothetical protein